MNSSDVVKRLAEQVVRLSVGGQFTDLPGGWTGFDAETLRLAQRVAQRPETFFGYVVQMARREGARDPFKEYIRFSRERPYSEQLEEAIKERFPIPMDWEATWISEDADSLLAKVFAKINTAVVVLTIDNESAAGIKAEWCRAYPDGNEVERDLYTGAGIIGALQGILNLEANADQQDADKERLRTQPISGVATETIPGRGADDE